MRLLVELALREEHVQRHEHLVRSLTTADLCRCGISLDQITPVLPPQSDALERRAVIATSRSRPSSSRGRSKAGRLSFGPARSRRCGAGAPSPPGCAAGSRSIPEAPGSVPRRLGEQLHHDLRKKMRTAVDGLFSRAAPNSARWKIKLKRAVPWRRLARRHGSGPLHRACDAANGRVPVTSDRIRLPSNIGRCSNRLSIHRPVCSGA